MSSATPSLDCIHKVISLLPEISHGKRKMAERGETSAGLRCVFYHARTGVSSTAGDVLVTCDTTYRTGLRDNNCPRAQKFLARSLDRACAFHIERNRVCKPVSFSHKCGWRQHKRTRQRPAVVSLFLLLLPLETSASLHVAAPFPPKGGSIFC